MSEPKRRNFATHAIQAGSSRRPSTGAGRKPGAGAHGGAMFAPTHPNTIAFRKSCGLEVDASDYAGEVTCLRCQKEFQSADRRKFRVCNHCKTTKDWKQGGSLRGGELHAGRPDDLPMGIKYDSGDRGKAHRARISQNFLKKGRKSAKKVERRLEAILKEENE